jgi:hypothetical protein
VRPTAVITESMEKTMSRRRTWAMTLAKLGATRRTAWPGSPSSLSWISFTDL